jgi:Bacterial Ig-like domain
MPRFLVTAALSSGLCLLVSAAPARAAGVHASGTPFPSDRFTVLDLTQNTFRRVNLPKPPCAQRPSDCADIDVINTLDGFNLQPRLAVRFDGPIDVATVSSQTVFLVRLGSTRPSGQPPGHIVGINQVVWDPESFTLYAESDELLEQHTVYLLVVTGGVRDLAGNPVQAAKGFAEARQAELAAVEKAGFDPFRVAAASIFTTQSATSTLEKVRAQIKAATPAPADFVLGSDGSRTVFPIAGISSILFQRQVTTTVFQPVPVPTPALGAFPGAVGQLAFGRYRSPDYEAPGGFIPPIGTRTGVPAPQRTSDIYFTLFLPASPRPPQGWPVALFGHGFGDNKNNSPFAVAASLASRGIATAAINVVGHGGGPGGFLVVSRTAGGAVSLSAGGRSVDQNGDTRFDATEGSGAAPPREIIGSRDGLRQTVIDLMQLVREIEVGMDVDGDGSADLDRARIYYFGQSFGAIYGTTFLAVEPSVPAGVPNVGGGAVSEIVRLGTFRPLLAAILAQRVPPLLNLGADFDDNLPLRDQAPVVNDVPGALPIQELIEHQEWVTQPGNPVAYARHLRRSPLRGVPAKSVIFQFAKGDQTVPNPTTSAILRAGELADRATFFRNDLAFAADPTVPRNPHTFLTRLFTPSVAAVAFGAQLQIATFLASHGTVIVDPDGPGPLFEVPIVPPLPEDLFFIP